MPTGPAIGGAYAPDGNYTRTGATDTGGTYSSATLSGTTTIGAGATLTSATLVTPSITGNARAVITGSGATITLTAAQSGALFVFDRAAGIVVTLPAPVVGLSFEFVVATTITGGAAEIDTDAGTTFMVGSVIVAVADTTPSATAGPKLEAANGTSTVKIASNGTTTGGIKGQWLRLVCISTTVWHVSGVVYGSGTIATPFA